MRRKLANRPFRLSHHVDLRAEQLLAVEPPAGIGHNCPPDSSFDDEVFTTRQAAQWFGTSMHWFDLGRSRGYGPEFVPLGPRCVRYKRKALRKYLQERARLRVKQQAQRKAQKLARKKQRDAA